MKTSRRSPVAFGVRLLACGLLLVGGRAMADGLVACQKSAEAGDADAQFQLGARYEMGRDVPRDFAKAESWFEKSAAQGNANGEMMLGTCYMSGMAVPLDMTKARYWFGKAAKQGNEAAIGMLATLNANAVEAPAGTEPFGAPKPAQPPTAATDPAAPDSPAAPVGGVAAAATAAAAPIGDINLVTAYQPESVLLQRKDTDDPKIAGTIGYYLLRGISTKKNTDEAAKWIKTAADKGDPFALGLQAQYALGQPKDVAKALAAYEDAFNKGNDLAAYHLGQIYFTGEDVAKDAKQSASWSAKGAANGNALAEAALAGNYVLGDGVEGNHALAYNWAWKSATQGCDIGEFKLGSCYVLGVGVDVDFGIALYWLDKSIAQGNAAAIENTAKLKKWMVEKGRDTTPADAVTAEDPAAMAAAPTDDTRLSSCQTMSELLKRSDLHDPRVAGFVGYYYLDGIGTKADPKEGAKWVNDAASRGDPFAKSLQYEFGIGVEKDPAQAVALTRPLAEKGDDTAQIQLGYFYQNGIGVDKDVVEANTWYQKSAELGNGYAEAHMGEVWLFGQGPDHDDGQAVACFRLSAGEGNPLGECHLGECYAHGVGVEKNYELAIRWLKKSAAQGEGEDLLKQVRYAVAHPETTAAGGQIVIDRRFVVNVLLSALVTGILEDDPGPSKADQARFAEGLREQRESDAQQQAYLQKAYQ